MIAKVKSKKGYLFPKIVSSKQYIKWENSAIKELLLYKEKFEDWKGNITVYPINIAFYIIRKTDRIWDWLNLVQGPLDVLVKAGFIPDDSAKYVHPIFEGWHIDKNDPKVIIKIFKGD